MSRRVIVQAPPFAPADELERLEASGGGAVASFIGLVRGDGGIAALMLEHHPGMTGSAMEVIAAEAERRWPLAGLTLIHRFGELRVGERIVFVGCASPHRAAALDATAFLIDWLKTRAPFWKKEIFADGAGRWVEAKASDDRAAARWDES